MAPAGATAGAHEGCHNTPSPSIRSTRPGRRDASSTPVTGPETVPQLPPAAVAALQRLNTPLYQARTKAGLTAQQLAELAGLDKNGVWVITATELGAAVPTEETSQLIHHALGLPPGTIDFPWPEN